MLYVEIGEMLKNDDGNILEKVEIAKLSWTIMIDSMWNRRKKKQKNILVVYFLYNMMSMMMIMDNKTGYKEA